MYISIYPNITQPEQEDQEAQQIQKETCWMYSGLLVICMLAVVDI